MNKRAFLAFATQLQKLIHSLVIFSILFSNLSIPVSAFAYNVSVKYPVFPYQPEGKAIPQSIDTQLPDRPIIEQPAPRIGTRPEMEIEDSLLGLSPFAEEFSTIQNVADESTSTTSTLLFVENVGQFDANVSYGLFTDAGSAFFTSDSLWMSVVTEEEVPIGEVDPNLLPPFDDQNLSPEVVPTPAPYITEGEEGSSKVKVKKGTNLRLYFKGANANPQIEGFDRSDAKVSYFLGKDESKWKPDVPVWKGVRYIDLYPGIDLVISSENGQWSWNLDKKEIDDTTLKNLNDGQQYQMIIEGANDLQLENDTINILTDVGTVQLPRLLTNDSALENSKDKDNEEGKDVNLFEVVPVLEKEFSDLPEEQSTQTPSSELTATETPDETLPADATETPEPITTLVPEITSTETTLQIPSPETNLDSYFAGVNLTITGDRKGLSGLASLVLPSQSVGNLTESSDLQVGDPKINFSTTIPASVGFSIATDSSGYIYLAGNSGSTQFPTKPGSFQTLLRGGVDAIVAKLSPDGKSLIYSTFIGGSNLQYVDEARDIDVDDEGNAYITGRTYSADFPVTDGSFQESFGQGGSDGFVTKLNATGTDLVYSTYLGGSSGEQGFSIAVNSYGEAYAVGQTFSVYFPAKDPIKIKQTSEWDGYITKLNATGSNIIYSTTFGGSGSDCEISGDFRECSVTVDSQGYAYVSGPTYSTNFLTALGNSSSSYDLTYNGAADGFVIGLKPNGALEFATYFGGSGSDCLPTCAMKVDPTGVYIAGSTSSSDFPSTMGDKHLGYDSFVLKFPRNLKNLVYSVLFGGDSDDTAHDITVSYANAYVIGDTFSADFPITPDEAFQPTLSGSRDAFVVKIPPSGAGLAYASFLGGSNIELGYGVTAVWSGTGLFTGSTYSNNFPKTAGTFPTNNSSGMFLTALPLAQYTKVYDPSVLSGDDCCEATINGTQPYQGDPINTRTGGYDDSFTDLSFLTTAGEMSFQRIYSSAAINLYTSTLGYGWTHNHDQHLVFPDDPDGEEGMILYKSRSANIYRFAINGDGTFTTEPGLLSTLVQNAGSPISYTIIDKSQQVATLDEQGSLIQWADAQGKTWFYSYVNGKLDRVTDDSGQRYLDFDYDLQSRIQVVSDHTGRDIHFTYNPVGDLETVTDVLDHTWTYTYDDLHHLRIVRDPANIIKIHTEYDALGRAYQQYDSDGTKLLEIIYNNDGTSTTIDAQQNTTIDTLDARSTLTNQSHQGSSNGKTFDFNFRPVALSDANGNSTTMTWNSTGANLTQIIDAAGGQTDLTYNDQNNLTSYIDQRNFLTTFTYNENDPDVTRKSLLLEVEDALSNTTTYTYTTTSDAPQPSGLLKTITDPLNHTTTYTYDQFGQMLSITDADLNTTYYAYDDLGRVIEVRDPTGKSNWTCYDPAGRVIRTVANASGDASTPEEDPCNTLAYQVSSDPNFDQITTSVYDLGGNQIGTIDPRGIITRTYFDENNRPIYMARNLVGQDIGVGTPSTFDPDYPDQNILMGTVYDEVGTVIATVNPHGIITRTYYDNFNRPKYSVQNLYGQSIENPNIPVFDPDFPDRNIVTETRYDDAGNVIAFIDAAGIIHRTYYDLMNRPVFTTANLRDPNNLFASVDDLLSLELPPAFSTTHPDWNVTTQTVYDEAGNAVKAVDPLGRVTQSCYDAIGNLYRMVLNPTGDGSTPQTDPCDSVNYQASSNSDVDQITDFVFDSAGNQIASLDPAGILTRTWYDERNRAVKSTLNLKDPNNPDATVNDLLLLSEPPSFDPLHPDQNITTESVYDDIGLTIATVDAAGRITRTYYDEFERPVTTVRNLVGQTVQNNTPPNYNLANTDENIRADTIYDSYGRMLATRANDGTVTRTYFDELDRPITVVRNLAGQSIENPIPPSYDPLHPDQNLRTGTVYDGAGNVVLTIDASGRVAHYCYDNLSRTTKTVVNPSIDNPCIEYTPSTDSDLDVTTTTVYDQSGNQVSIQSPTGEQTTSRYDALGRLTHQTDSLQNTIQYAYDANGNQVQKIDAKGIVTLYEYDNLNRLSAVVENYHAGATPDHETNVRTEYSYDKVGNRLSITDALTHVTTFGYDALNRLTGESDPLDHLTAYFYDAIGNRIQVDDANGATIYYSYDNLDRLETIDYPLPDADVTFTYDANGNRKTMLDGTGTTVWNYDQSYRIDQITNPQNKVVKYGYNAIGNRTTITYPDNKQISYEYDTAGRLDLVTSWDTLATTYSYTKNGNVNEITLPVGLISTYQYNDNGNLENIAHTSTTDVYSTFQYAYDSNGNRKSSNETLMQVDDLMDEIFASGFETGDMSEWTSNINDNGDLSVTDQAPIIGSRSLTALIDDQNAIYVTDETPSSLSHYRARFYLDTSDLQMGTGDSFVVFQINGNPSKTLVQIEYRFSTGEEQLSAKIFNDAGSFIRTPWRTIVKGVHYVEIDWFAATEPGANNGSATLWVDSVQQGDFYPVDNDTLRVDFIQLGAVSDIDSGTRGTILFDGFESRNASLIGPDPNAPIPPILPQQGDSIFSDGFESGDLSNWSVPVLDGGDLSVSSISAIVGNQGLQASINDNNPLSITDWSPVEEKHYHARFYFDPNSISMANYNSLDLFIAGTRSLSTVGKVQLQFNSGEYQMRLLGVSDSGATTYSPSVTVLDGPHAIELEWNASSGVGANNGGMILWIDGTQEASITGIDNDSLTIDYVKIGVCSGAVSGTRGTIYFDAFASNRQSAIGLDPSAFPPPSTIKEDPIFGDGFEAGSVENWTSSYSVNNSLTITTAAAIAGTYGMQVTGNPGHVTDWQPYDETHYRARFFFDPNSALLNGEGHDIFRAMSRNGTTIFDIFIQKTGSSYLVSGVTCNDAGACPYAFNAFTLSDRIHVFEVEWFAATAAGSNNGGFNLWLDGEKLSGTVSNVDNDTLRVDEVILGVFSGNITGTEYFDSFESHRETAIGTDLSVPYYSFNDGFESGDLLAWSNVVNDGQDLSSSTLAAITDSYGLQATINDLNSLYVIQTLEQASVVHHGRFYFDPNSLSMGNGDSFYIYNALDTGENNILRIELNENFGDYRIRIEVKNDSGSWISSPWSFITDGPHAFEYAWQESTSTTANDGALGWWIDGVEQVYYRTLDNDTHQLKTIQLGAVADLDASTHGSFYIDGYSSRNDVYIGLDPAAPSPVPPDRSDPIFADGLESGDFSAWSETAIDGGDLVSTAKPIIGSYAMQSTINDNNVLYVTDWKPYDESSYRARFYFDPNSIAMANGDAHYLFYARNRDGLGIIRIEMRSEGGLYQVRAETLNDYSSWISTPWISISDFLHCIEFNWKAATSPTISNGKLTFWVDGIQKSLLSAINNDTRKIDYVQLGVVEGVDNSTRGAEIFDGFISYRESYIGLDATAPTSVIFADDFELGNVSLWSSYQADGNNLGFSTSGAITGGYSLALTINDFNDQFVVDANPDNEDQYRVRFYYDPNTIQIDHGAKFTLLQLLQGIGQPVAKVETRKMFDAWNPNSYQIGISIRDDGDTWYSYKWVPIADGPHAVEIDWRAATGSDSNDGYFDLFIDGNQVAAISTIDNANRRVDEVRLGAFDFSGSSILGAVYFDLFESRRDAAIGLNPEAPAPPSPIVTDYIFSDGFESGNLSLWSGQTIDSGDLSVSSIAANGGAYGLQAMIDDNNPLLITESSPDQEAQYRVQFYFDPNSVTMADGDQLTLITLYDQDNLPAARLDFRSSAGDYQVGVAAYDDSGSWTDMKWMRVTDRFHTIEIEYHKSTGPGMNNGQVILWVDQAYEHVEWSGLDNDTHLIDFITLGVEGLDDGTRGSLFFDYFASRETRIPDTDPEAPPLGSDPSKGDAVFADGFETGDMGSWHLNTIDGGDLSVTSQAALVGTYGLQAVIDDATPIYVTDYTPWDENRLRMRFYFNPNTVAMAEGDQFTIYSALNRYGDPAFQVELGYSDDSYQIRSGIADDYGNWTYSAWMSISDNPVAIEIEWWQAWSVDVHNGRMLLWIDDQERSYIENIDNDTKLIDQVLFGAVEGIDAGTTGVVYLDAYESRRDTHIGFDPSTTVSQIFTDGFEDGTFTQWSSVLADGNDLSVTPSATMVGTYGLALTVNDGQDQYVVDNRPTFERRYRARFYFDPNSIVMENGAQHTLFSLIHKADTPISRLEFSNSAGDYQVRVVVRKDDNTWVSSSWYTITDGPHWLEIDWKAASGVGVNDGYLTLWIDSQTMVNLSAIDNDTYRVDSARMGAFNGVSNSFSGTEYFDGFVSRRDAYIGQDPNGPDPVPTPVKEDPIFSDGFETGDFSAWSRNTTDDGDLSITSQAALVGTYGLQAVIDDATPIYVTDYTPWDENRLRMRFYVDPNSLIMDEGDQFTIFSALKRDNTAAFKIELRNIRGAYQIRDGMVDDAGNYIYGPWITISDEGHSVEIEWWRAWSDTVPDGRMTMWIDNEDKGNISDIDNDTKYIDLVKLGVVEGVDQGTQGTIFFDDYVSRRDYYINIDPSGYIPNAFDDQFESGNLLAWTSSNTDNGDLYATTSTGMIGTYGLQAVIDDNNEVSVTKFGLDPSQHYRIRFYYDPNTIQMAEGNVLYLLYGINPGGTNIVRVELRKAAGEYQVRAETSDDSSAWRRTIWYPLLDGPHAIELDWQAATAAGANNGYLSLWMDGSQLASVTTLDNDTRSIGGLSLGMFGVDSGTRGTVFFDGFKARRDPYIGQDPAGPQPPTPPAKPDVIFADSFESGNLSAWSASAIDTGHLSVSSASAIVGSSGMQAYVNDNNALYVTDWSPYEDTHYRARFYFDPNSLKMGATDKHYIFYGYTRNDTLVLRMELQNSVGDHQIRVEALTDGSSWVGTNFYTLLDGPHAIEFEWQAATGETSNNGRLVLWIDGTQQQAITTIDNDDWQIDYVHLGGVAGIDTGTRGTDYFDAFVSHRESYIGTDAGALPPPVKGDAIFADGFESGNFNAWSQYVSNTNLSVTSGAALVGTRGLRVNLASSTTKLFVTDWNPSDESQYRARFYLDPNTITMSTGSAHYIFYGLDRAGTKVLRIELGKSASGYQVRAGAVNNSTTWSTTTYFTITDAPHYLEVQWQAATGSGANNGILSFWVDGTNRGSFTNLNNDTRRIDYVQLGAVDGVDTTSSGMHYFDAFDSHRNSYIGQAALLDAGIQMAAQPQPVDPPFAGGKLAKLMPQPVETPAERPLQDSSTLSVVYTYDPLNRLTAADYSNGSYFHYNYDAVGNRLSETTLVGRTCYYYDIANRLTHVYATSNTQACPGTPTGTAYTWDDNGNLLSDGAKTYTYNHANRLTAVSGAGLAVSYVYNGLGERTSETVNGVTTDFVLDLAAGLSQVLTAETSGVGTTIYLYGNGRIAQYTPAGTDYFLGDALGSVRQMVDGDGVLSLVKRYEPYGEVMSSDGSGASAYGYTGEQHDVLVKLTYLRSRYYSGYLNQFIQADTIVPDPRTPADWNKYTYVRNNPIRFTDPTGHICLDPWAPSGIHLDPNQGCDYPEGSTGSLWWRRDPLGPDTAIIEMPWVDEQSQTNWNKYPNSCGASALYMLLKAEGATVDFDRLVQQLQSERPGGYNGYCCNNTIGDANGTNPLPTVTPDPLGWCNKACVSGEALATVARKYYGLDIVSNDNWTHLEVYERVSKGHSVLALIRSEVTTDHFGHFVVIRGFIDGGWTVVFNDSYPGEAYWDTRGGSSEIRSKIGVGREAKWDDFDASWASNVDSMDPMLPGGHVRWAMSVR